MVSKEGGVLIRRSNFKKIFDRYFTGLVSFANTYVNDLDLSEDIVQEVFVNLWEKRGEFAGHFTLKVYLYRAVRNKCLNSLQHKKVARVHNEDMKWSTASEEFFLNQVLSEEVVGLLYKAIAQLPEKRQQIVRYSLMGMKNHEIAETMSLTLNTIKSQKMHAYRELRSKMGKHAYLIAVLLELNF